MHPSQHNTNQPITPIVHDTLQGALHALLHLFVHAYDLALHAVADEVIERFAEDIRLPDGGGILLEGVRQVLDEGFAARYTGGSPLMAIYNQPS